MSDRKKMPVKWKVCTECGDKWTYKPQATKCTICGGELRKADD